MLLLLLLDFLRLRPRAAFTVRAIVVCVSDVSVLGEMLCSVRDVQVFVGLG